mmetsp:Transcript_21670/g.32077  ORF Transcript_21670/g.32077 Transcript_21670/m.32077 type:complete len:93 (+) Transcript_21670:190-468(+)
MGCCYEWSSPVIEWARENGCEWNWRTGSLAAGYGHFSCLKWLIKDGCEMNYKTIAAAAEGGHYSIILWLRKEKKCEWNGMLLLVGISLSSNG